MANLNTRELIDVLNDCIDRLANGESVESCLRAYPDYASSLRPMLEAGLLVARAQASAMETNLAQSRVRATVTQTLEMPVMTRRRTYSTSRFAGLAASVILGLILLLGGAGVMEVARRIQENNAATATPTMTPSPTLTVTPSPSPTATMTSQPSTILPPQPATLTGDSSPDSPQQQTTSAPQLGSETHEPTDDHGGADHSGSDHSGSGGSGSNSGSGSGSGNSGSGSSPGGSGSGGG